MAELNKQQTSILIELYHEHRVLWDNKCKEYKDQRARNNALLSMKTRFRAACNVVLDLRDIKTKIQSFRTSVCRELNKMEKTLSSDAGPHVVYMPTYSYWTELQFLRPFLKKRTSKLVSELQDTDDAQGEQELEDEESSVTGTSPSNGPINGQRREASPGESSLESLPALAVPPLPIQFSEARTPTPPASVSAAKTPTPRTLASAARTPTPQASTSSQHHQLLRLAPAASRLSFATPERQPSAFVPLVRKRRPSHSSDSDAVTTLGQYYKKKAAAFESIVAGPSLDLCNPDMIWAQNLVNDLNKISSSNKKSVLQIKISRLVHDAILEQLEKQVQ